jgi:hypothetical protein
MKKLVFGYLGGRPFDIDDFETLQAEVYAALSATFGTAPAMVLSGCEVSPTGPNVGDIGPGFVWLQGEVHYYPGAAAVALPAEVVAGAVQVLAAQPYEDGNTKTTISVLELITQPGGTAAAGVEKIEFVAGPVQRYAKWLESQTRTIGEVQWLSKHAAGLYDASGKGWVDLAGAGWALCNGQNGTADLRERFVVGLSPAVSDYSAPGNVGGSATVTLGINEMPVHSHGMQPAGQHSHRTPTRGGDGNNQIGRRGDANGDDGNVSTAAAGSHTHAIDEAGGGLPHENRPPFYVLVAREWVGL